ncbi:PTAC2 [Symbiodinium sp. CCMP2456]|nr:PTAC2 [Symbiodinium sp. CCMP2456]
MGRAVRWSCALRLQQTLQEALLEPDRITFNAAMSACSRAGRWESALDLLADMLHTGPVPSLADFNVMISALGDAGQWEHAQHLFSVAVAAALEADIVTYTSLISALSMGKRWELALSLLGATVEKSLQPQLRSYNVALSALRRAHAWRNCLRLAAGASAAGLHPDIITQNELLRASARAGQWQLVHSLLRGLGTLSCRPSRVTFNAALQAAEFGPGVDLSLQLLDEIPRLRLSREPVDFSPVILGCLAAGRMQNALEVLGSMLEDVCGKGLVDVAAQFDRSCLKRLQRTRALQAIAACLTPLLSACESETSETSETGTELALLQLVGFGIDYEETGEGHNDSSHEELLQLAHALAPVGLAARLSARGRASEASELLWELLDRPVPAGPGLTTAVLSRRAALALQAELRKRPVVYVPSLPRLGAAEAPSMIPLKRAHARELSLLRYVLMEAKPGNPASLCEAVEAHSQLLGKEGMWSKIAGGSKADCLLAAAAGSAEGPVLEIGTFCGYATLCLAQALPDVRITSLETDPTMVAIARTFMALSGVAARVDIRTGNSRNLLPMLEGSFGMVFMDFWGSQYMETCQDLAMLGQLRPGSTVVADNVLETGAMLYLWHVANPVAYFHTQVMAVSEFTRTGNSGVEEDWLSVSVFVPPMHGVGSSEPQGPPPAKVIEAHEISERMREVVFSPGHTVTARERSEDDLKKMPSLWKQPTATVHVAAANEAGQSRPAKLEIRLATCMAWSPSSSDSESSATSSSGLPGSPQSPDFEEEIQKRSGPELRRWLQKQLKAPLVAWLKTLRLPTSGTKEDLVERVLDVMGM